MDGMVNRAGMEELDAQLSHGDGEHLRILSRTDWVEPVALFLKNEAIVSGVCDQGQADRLVVAMTEAITNAVVHGNYELGSELKQQGGDAFGKALAQRQADPQYFARVVDIRIDYQPDRCTWTITDEGRGFDVDKAVARLESDDPMELLASGRGISIMKAFVDEVNWSAGGRRIQLTVHMGDGRERRVADRRQYTATVGVHPSEGQPHEALGRDLSETGIAFVTTHLLRPGQAATVTLDLHQPTQRMVTGKIVRCQSVAHPYHDAAVQFDQPITLD